MSDAVAPVLLGDVAMHESFETLYTREFRSLVRLAMAMVDSQDVAEEVVQDAFARLYSRYDSVASPIAYVRVSVLNGSRQVLRRRRLMRRQPPQRDETQQLGVNHVIDAIRRLPKRQCDAVMLRYDLQLTDTEIADTLGLPLGTVKSTLHRALAQLRLEVIR